MMRKRICLTLSLFIFSFIVYSQQQWPSTFLWKITGNGLAKPSYLYGTIHLADKRLFNFGDSLYHFIEKAEGFALEIDMQEMVDSIFTLEFRQVEEDLINEPSISIEEKKLGKTADTLLKKFELNAKKITKKDLKKIREYRMNKLMQQGEMETVVDGFLYAMALRHGKLITGIEDVNDQLGISDELGGQLKPESVFEQEATLKKTLEQMIDIYVHSDLQKVADFSWTDDKEFRDALLTNRNVKMARRMDSLSAIRSMFFAVGVAHLPGDSGVIQLLKNKGFILEPVFSAKTIDALAYLNKLTNLAWSKVEENLYSVEMPGKASDHKMFGEAVTMKTFFDLPTMTVYMTGQTLGKINSKDDVVSLFKNIGKNMSAFNANVKPTSIWNDSLKGGEALFEIPQGYGRIRMVQHKNTLFMIMASSPKRNALFNTSTQRFFSSFKAKEAIQNREWAMFSIPGKSFSVKLPGQPTANTTFDKKAEGSGWNFITYNFVDAAKGLYYLIQVREIRPGFYLEGDTSYYDSWKEEAGAGFDELRNPQNFLFKGWPAFKIDAVLKSQGVMYKVFNVNRGNRIYYMMIGGEINADFSDAEEVFNSLELENYPTKKYTQANGDGFYTSAPSAFTKATPDTTKLDTEATEQYTAYDEQAALSFEVIKQPIPTYYWIKNDSLYFEAIERDIKGSDSLLAKTTLNIGSLRAIDLVVEKEGNNTLKKVRSFINGDTLYSVMVFIPKQYIDNKEYNKFFDNFRVTNEVAPTIYKNKAKELLTALKTTDSIQHYKVLETFNTVTFAREDLPHLYNAILETYPQFDDEYITINSRISEKIIELADSTTVPFVANSYGKLTTEQEAARQPLLYLLASIKTIESYSLLKNYLVAGASSSETDYKLLYALKDSLELTATLFPAILQQVKDTNFIETLVSLSNMLADSNLLKLQDMMPYKMDFLKDAKRRLAIMKKDAEDWQLNSDWIQLTGKFNDKEANQLLNEMLAVSENEIRYWAVMSLLKNNQPVAALQLEKLASDNWHRKPFYEQLKKMDKQQLLPAKWATRQKIGESEIFLYASDEAEAKVKFVGERTAEFMGKKQKFLLYQVSFVDDEATESYLGIVGPHPLTGTEIIVDGKATGVHWSEEFDKNKLDSQLKAYLQSIQEYVKENNDDASTGK